ELLVGHRPIGGAEIDGAVGHLPDAAAAADRLIVDLHLGITLVELVEPLRVDRIGERGPRTVDQDGGTAGPGDGERQSERSGQLEPPPSHASPPLVVQGTAIAYQPPG